MPSSSCKGVANRAQYNQSLQSGRNSSLQFSFYNNKRKKKDREAEGDGRSGHTRISPPTKERKRKLVPQCSKGTKSHRSGRKNLGWFVSVEP